MSSLKYYIDSLYELFMRLRYRNKPYIEYYRAVMKRRTKQDPMTATGGRHDNWNSVGKMQLERLQRYGLKPHHTVFDLGCGTLRGGRHVIGYLNTGNYAGNDISQEILDEAAKLLERENLQGKKPRLFFTNDVSFNEVAGEKFDFIHAQSVLSHMPPEDIETLYQNVVNIMHKDSQFLASFFLSTNGTIYPGNISKNFYYPIEWMQKTAAKSGLNVEMVETDSKQKLMRITPK